MTEPNLLSRFQADLVCRIAGQEIVPERHTLSISPWVAMSLLQKAIRRGRTNLALVAAATLLRDAPDRLWRRLAIIAFEDVGLGSLPVVGLTTAALSGKRFREAIGGDWVVASIVVESLAMASKSRATDDFYAGIIALPCLVEKRLSLATESNARLEKIALTTPCLYTRALAVLFLLGTNRPGGTLPARRGNVAVGFALLAELGIAPTTLAICREGYKKTGEVLPALLAVLALENGLRATPADDPLPSEVMIGCVPNWCLDMFTREGKNALSRLLSTNSAVAELACCTLPSSQRLKFLGRVLFRVESGLLVQRIRGDLSDKLHRQHLLQTLGVKSEIAAEALSLMRQDLPLLNEIRALVMKEVRDA